ncbi:hypothetical protein [Streptosporangium sp. CA-115845]|uniref:hypothetical protein n=1 Tax=Streptosporangium sp. CA-115845 TaxID=3240071 RepID=UPI003D8AF75A
MAVLLSPLRHLRAVPKSGVLIGAAIVALGTLEAFTVATEYGATETPDLWWAGQALGYAAWNVTGSARPPRGRENPHRPGGPLG